MKIGRIIINAFERTNRKTAGWRVKQLLFPFCRQPVKIFVTICVSLKFFALPKADLQ